MSPLMSAKRPDFNTDTTQILPDITYSTPKNGVLRKKSGRKGKDPRADHPAMLKYRDLVHYCVPIAIRGKVIDTVSESSADISKWENIVTEWVGRGYNPHNILGMLQVFMTGWGHPDETLANIKFDNIGLTK